MHLQGIAGLSAGRAASAATGPPTIAKGTAPIDPNDVVEMMVRNRRFDKAFVLARYPTFRFLL
jgi:hypothetical protein